MIYNKEEMFLAEMGINAQATIEGDYTATYKLKDLLKEYAEQCNIAPVVRQSEQLPCGDLMKHIFSLSKIGRCIACDRAKEKAR